MTPDTAPRVDIHAHVYPERYAAALQSAGFKGGGGIVSMPSLEARLEVMDRAGVDVQVVSTARMLPYFEDKDAAQSAARLGNELLAEFAARAPDRIRALAVTPLPHIEATLQELRYALDDLGMAGMELGTSVLGRSLADPAFEPVWEELDRRGALVHVHPLGNALESPLVGGGWTWRLGAPFEDTLAAAQLIAAGVASRWSNLQIVISHGAGTLPMLLGRMDALSGHERAPEELAELPSSAARQLWYDTCTHDVNALNCAWRVLGSERLVFGSDFPYLDGDHYVHAVQSLEECGMSAGEASTVLRANGSRLIST